jgi:hypothetical protein
MVLGKLSLDSILTNLTVICSLSTRYCYYPRYQMVSWGLSLVNAGGFS